VKVENANDAVEVSSRPAEGPNAFILDLNVPKRTPSRAIRDTWTITLDVDGAEHVETVPVTIILSQQN
jgi:hypothetical protein